MDRINQIEQYLNDPDQMARFRAELLAALYDPGWANSRNAFDWLRFAREFTAPDFEPPLESMTFFSFLLKPHFAPPQRLAYFAPQSHLVAAPAGGGYGRTGDLATPAAPLEKARRVGPDR